MKRRRPAPLLGAHTGTSSVDGLCAKLADIGGKLEMVLRGMVLFASIPRKVANPEHYE